MKKSLALILLLALSLTLFSACGGSSLEDGLAGIWICENDDIDHAWMCMLSFHAQEDGSGTFTDFDGDSGVYFINGQDITFVFDDYDITLTLQGSIANRQLTLQGDGVHVTLTRWAR